MEIKVLKSELQVKIKQVNHLLPIVVKFGLRLQLKDQKSSKQSKSASVTMLEYL